MKLSELFLNRWLYKETLQNLETKDSVYNSGNLNAEVPTSVAAGGSAVDLTTGNVPVGGPIGDVSTIAPDIVPIGLSVTTPAGITLSANGMVSAYLTLTWNAIISATFDHYQIRYKKNAYVYYQYIDSQTNTITIDNLSPNALYNFGISSVNKYGTSSAFSTDISTTTATNSTPPATVTGLATTAGIQYVIATWTSNTESDIASYNIYRHTANNSALASLVGSSFTNYFIDGGLTGGTPYYYWIKAVNTSGYASTAFSTVSTATPRNIITNDIGANQITAPLTSLAAINAISGDLNSNTVGTSQLQDNAVGSQESNIALRGWEQTCAFTATDADTVTWGAGTFTTSNGDSYSILTGNTGNMVAKTYIYLNIAVSTTTYQTTTTATIAIGDGKVLIAIAQNNATEATFMLLNNNSYNIDAANIVAGSITANEIQAGAIIASKITSYNFQLSAGTFTNNSPTAGKVAWVGAKVVYAGTEYSITDGNCLATDKHIYWQLASPNIFSASATLPALGNDDFLVVFNNSGVALFVWNSTIINGNRITTGSITATNIAANTLTANEIAAGTITADRINSNSFAFSAISFTANAPTAGKVAWTGCKVVYKGIEYAITNGSCLATDQHIYWQLSSPNVFAASATLPALGNDDFLVVYNDAGTPKYVWNSTIINGNRISTGSIYTGQIATGTITGTNIAGSTIASSNILSVNADKILIDGAVYLSNWRAGTELTKIDGGNLYVGSQITIGSALLGGHIKSGQTDYNTGVGWWIGSVAGVPKFSIGNPSDSYFTYDSGTGVMTLKGTITATAGNVGGWVIQPTYIYYNGATDATSSGMASLDYPFYAGKKYVDRATAPFRVTPAGALYASSAEISGKLTTGAGSSISGTYIDSIDAAKINVGTLTGFLIQTSASANTGIKMSDALGGIDIYGQTVEIFYGSTSYGYMGATNGYFGFTSVSDRNMKFDAGSGTCFFAAAGIAPLNSGDGSCGLSSQYWSDVYTNNLTLASGKYFNYTGGYIQSNSQFRVVGSITTTGNLTFENDASITINGRAYYQTTGAYDASKYYLRS